MTTYAVIVVCQHIEDGHMDRTPIASGKSEPEANTYARVMGSRFVGVEGNGFVVVSFEVEEES